MLHSHSRIDAATLQARRAEEERRAIEHASNAPIVIGMLGVCCSCQQSHPIVEAPPSHGEDDDDFDFSLKSDAEGYVMAPHSMYADIYAEPEIRKENPDLLMCDGVGTMPQAVYENKTP